VDEAQAAAAGAAARAAGQPSRDVPFVDGPLRAAWLRGWLRARDADLYGALLRRP